MATDQKPRRVKAKIVATVTMTAFVVLDRSGQVDEFVESDDILDVDNIGLLDIKSVITTFED